MCVVLTVKVLTSKTLYFGIVEGSLQNNYMYLFHSLYANVVSNQLDQHIFNRHSLGKSDRGAMK